MKVIIACIVVIALAFTKSSAQSINIPPESIEYNLPRDVSKMANAFIIQSQNAKIHNQYFFLIGRNTDYTYVSIINNDTLGDNSNLFKDKFLNRTNRYVVINSKIIPVLLDLDLEFAILERITHTNGKVSTTKFVITNDAYTIKFDRYGNIKQ